MCSKMQRARPTKVRADPTALGGQLMGTAETCVYGVWLSNGDMITTDLARLAA